MLHAIVYRKEIFWFTLRTASDRSGSKTYRTKTRKSSQRSIHTIVRPAQRCVLKLSTPLTTLHMICDVLVRVRDSELLPLLVDEFPFLHVSPATVQQMWRKQMNQIRSITRAELDRHHRPKAAVQLEEAEHKQRALLKVMKKDVEHTRRMVSLWTDLRLASQTVLARASGCRDKHLSEVFPTSLCSLQMHKGGQSGLLG